jgi:hypothetical protein
MSLSTLRYTLVSDGSSDRALMPILTWLLRENGVVMGIDPTWFDITRLVTKPANLTERIQAAIRLTEPDLLFVHRDAEREPYENRVTEIKTAIETFDTIPVNVCVVPVRMTEAWLLTDEQAIRDAAGNPKGKVSLAMPVIKQLESLSDPKQTLYALLEKATDLSGRRLKKFTRSLPRALHRVADYTDDFRPLRLLNAFQMLEVDVKSVIQNHFSEH